MSGGRRRKGGEGKKEADVAGVWVWRSMMTKAMPVRRETRQHRLCLCLRLSLASLACFLSSFLPLTWFASHFAVSLSLRLSLCLSPFLSSPLFSRLTFLLYIHAFSLSLFLSLSDCVCLRLRGKERMTRLSSRRSVSARERSCPSV